VHTPPLSQQNKPEELLQEQPLPAEIQPLPAEIQSQPAKIQPEVSKSSRTTAGKPPQQLLNDPRYTGPQRLAKKSPLPTTEESHLIVAQALASPEALR